MSTFFNPPRATLSALALTLAAPAFAECPTTADMTGNGVRFFNEGGDSERFFKRDDGFVVSIFEGKTGQLHSLLEKGLYLVESVSVDPDGTQSRTTFSMPVAWDDMPAPNHLSAFSMEVIGADEKGRFKQHQDYQFGEVGVLFVDGCAFEMIPVTLTYNGAAEKDLFTYLPSLGLAYLSGVIDADGTVTNFPYNEVEVVE